MYKLNKWAAKASIGLMLLALSFSGQAATVIPGSLSGPTNADIDFGPSPITGVADLSGPAGLNTAGIGVATFVLGAGQTQAAITVDPKPPTPLGIPANNYELELWSVVGGNFGSKIGSSAISSDQSFIKFFAQGLNAMGGVYAIVVGNNADLGASAVDLTRLDSVTVAVPVPAAVLLFIGGLVGLIGWRRRQGLPATA